MKKLTKEQIKQRDDLVIELETAYGALEAGCNELVDVHIHAYNKLVLQFNDVLTKARDFVGGITAEMDNYVDEKSEKWQEGDAGVAYIEWKQQWEDLDMEDVEEITIEANASDAPQSAIADTLQGLPETPE